MKNSAILPEDFSNKIVVFYDGSCPGCIKDMNWYQSRQRSDDDLVVWFDITGQDQVLKGMGIDPLHAMLELHVQDQERSILKSIPAYQILLKRLPGWHLIAILIGFPGIQQILDYLYRRWVRRRLCQAGRL